MNKEVNEERTPRTVADVKEMLVKHSNGEIQCLAGAGPAHRLYDVNALT